MKSRDFQLLTLSVPSILSICIFCYLPMFGLFIAFKDINYSQGIFKSKFIGFDNFKFFFNSQDAWRVTRNTLLYNMLFIILGLGIAIIIAIILYELSSWAVKILQTILFMPYFLSWVVVGFVAYIYLHPTLGVLNQVLLAAGGESINWYGARWVWPIVLICFQLWKVLGYHAIIFYTGLLGIDQSLYEAASIDGASRFQQRIYITLPLLKRLTIIMAVISVGKIMFADFGLFYFIPRNTGVLYGVTDVIDTYVYRALRVTGDIGMSAAASFYQSVIGFFLVFATNYLIKRISPEDALF